MRHENVFISRRDKTYKGSCCMWPKSNHHIRSDQFSNLTKPDEVQVQYGRNNMKTRSGWSQDKSPIYRFYFFEKELINFYFFW